MHGFDDNFVPGIAPVEFSPEPIATEGQATVGPDSLSPAIPEERDELQAQGFLDDDTQDDFSELLDTGTGTIGDPWVGEPYEPVYESEPRLPFL